MSATTILSNPYYDLLFHEDTKIIQHVYHPPMSGDQVQELLTAGTDLMEKYGATKWLSDNRMLERAFSTDVANWINNVWLKRTMKAGWKYWAMVVPNSVIGREDHIQYVESFYNTGVWVTVYTELEPALTWLETR